MVGTPPEKVTPSLLISSCRLRPSILSQGSTNLQPLIAAANGRPQAVPWYSDEHGITQSKADRPNAPLRPAASACSTTERWLYSTPLGSPVVPEV
ncbi:hypothetical protein D3C86_1709820 [compost metagenome]